MKKRKKGKKFSPLNLDNLQGASTSNTTPNTNANLNKDSNQSITTKPNQTDNKQSRNKTTMPPIVIDGKTTNQKQLVCDLKMQFKGEFSIKHTNYNTILFVENKDDHERIRTNIKQEKMAYHTYT